MATYALVLTLVYLALAFGVRTVLQLRSTGSTGFKGISGRAGSAEWTGGVLFAVAVVLLLFAPVSQIAGTLEPIGFLDGLAGRWFGFALYGLGLAGTLISQNALGASWRIGVDASERTELVTSGAFALVRNPIFAVMVPACLGLVLLAPNAAALLGLVALVAAIELQVRFVEEPYLMQTHGESYTRYASRVGRFVPGFGRLKM
ncbi:MAG: isoprenylcysteine carboxylmethyltransferase family protein [Rubrobacteraceae bacterium]